MALHGGPSLLGLIFSLCDLPCAPATPGPPNTALWPLIKLVLCQECLLSLVLQAEVHRL